ncbi:MAG: glycoside hydrolase family 97 protein [Prevotellaceae bacterium]|nr:glycoside hydrolase family 97 protein [Prevotellaceae bacterium]
MKHIIASVFFILITAICNFARAQKPLELLSPDGNIRLAIDLKDKIYYTVSNSRGILLQNNEIQLHLRNEILGKKPKLTSRKQSFEDSQITPVVPFKFSTVKNRYNQLLLNFKGNYSLEFRAFDDGVAYRFITRKKGEIDILNEDINIYFPDDYLLHVQMADDRGFATTYEEPYLHLESKQWKADSQMGELPVLIDTRKGTKILVSEADINDYPNFFVKKTEENNGLGAIFPHVPVETQAVKRKFAVSKTADYIARTSGTREFPWRYFIITENDGQLIESTMVCRLSQQNVIEDPSWIKPGLVMWDWINRHAHYGPEIDFVTGVNTASYKYFIDFSARYKIPYVLLDEGWAKDINHAVETVPEVDLPEIVRYGKEKNVGILLWISYRAVETDFNDDSYNVFEYFSKMGVRGFKIDFMDRSDQAIVNFYEQAAREAAKYHMLVELHGSYKPVGLENKYPNLLSLEGVRGLENHGNCTPDNSMYLPFMRNVLGPMSFTPGSMLNVQPEQYKGRLGQSPVFIGTRTYHIALYILFESGLQMTSDSPSEFDRNPDCAQFIFSTPVTWDETRALAAEAGQYAIVARRKGDKWWIGGITNNAEKVREFDIDLSFLNQDKTYGMTAFEDGLNAGKQAMDYSIRRQQVKKGDRIHIKMVRNGGWAAVLE